MSNRVKLAKGIQKECEEVQTYRLVSGSKHVRICVNEAQTGIVPHNIRGDGQDGGHATFNIVAQIRRAARMMPT